MVVRVLPPKDQRWLGQPVRPHRAYEAAGSHLCRYYVSPRSALADWQFSVELGERGGCSTQLEVLAGFCGMLGVLERSRAVGHFDADLGAFGPVCAAVGELEELPPRQRPPSSRLLTPSWDSRLACTSPAPTCRSRWSTLLSRCVSLLQFFLRAKAIILESGLRANFRLHPIPRYFHDNRKPRTLDVATFSPFVVILLAVLRSGLPPREASTMPSTSSSTSARTTATTLTLE